MGKGINLFDVCEDKKSNDMLEKMLVMLRDKGEKETFAYLRKLTDY